MQEDKDIHHVDDSGPQREIIDYFYLFLERSWIIFLFVVASGIYANYKIGKTPVLFQAVSTVEVERDLRPAANITDENRYVSQSEIVTLVSQKLKLNSLFYLVTESPRFQHLLPDPETVGAHVYESARQELGSQMNQWTRVTIRPNSTLIDIQTVHPDPEVAQGIIEEVIVMYNELGASTRDGESVANIKFLTKEIERIRGNLSDAEQSLVVYKEAFRIRDEYQASQSRIREMEKKYLEKWPPLVEEKSHQENLRISFVEELNRITDSSTKEEEFWKTHEPKLAALQGNELTSFQIRTAEARNNMINRDFETESELYESLLAQLKRGGVEREFDQSEFTVMQPPVAMDDPVSPGIGDYYLRYGILGLGMGLIVAFLLGVMDSTVRRIDDLEHLSGLSVFAAVPKGKNLNPISKKKSSSVSEAFRSLHASVLLSKLDAKSVLITSSIPGEGKSTVSSNLAVTAAKQGEKVLLVDLDLRRPKLQGILKLDPDGLGVNDCLSGNCSIDQAIHRHPEVENLEVMPAGQLRLHHRLPDEAKVAKLIEILEQKYDRIVIDTAPVLAVSDTLLISRHVDEVCLVFRMWKTPRKALARTLDLLDKNGTYPEGVVSNFMPKRKGLGQYAYYYSYIGNGYEAYA